MRLIVASFIAACLLLGSPAVRAEPTEAEVAYRALVRREPRPIEVSRAALKYFRIHPDALDALRSSAKLRALLPILTGGYRLDDTRAARAQTVTVTNPTQTDENANTTTSGVSAGVVFDLRELAFNPAQVQVYGLVGIQQDVMLEVIRTYYLRRQLQLRLMFKPPQDLIARATMELRVEEYGALLDSMTGGWFSAKVSGTKESEP